MTLSVQADQITKATRQAVNDSVLPVDPLHYGELTPALSLDFGFRPNVGICVLQQTARFDDDAIWLRFSLQESNWFLARLIDGVHVWPNGTDADRTTSTAGNVFEHYFDGIDINLLRGAAKVGMRTITSRDHPFELLVALGTEPFDNGFAIDQVRVAIGSPSSWRR